MRNKLNTCFVSQWRRPKTPCEMATVKRGIRRLNSWEPQWDGLKPSLVHHICPRYEIRRINSLLPPSLQSIDVLLRTHFQVAANQIMIGSFLLQRKQCYFPPLRTYIIATTSLSLLIFFISRLNSIEYISSIYQSPPQFDEFKINNA